MLIITDEHRRRAGVCSLDEVCPYCGFAFAEYPLILSDDPAQTVYHAACALQLATEILVDLFTFFHRQYPVSGSLRSPGRHPLHIEKEAAMQSTDLEEIKAALWEQASHPCTRVRWGTAQVVTARISQGQLRVMLRGYKRWYPADAVAIERPRRCPVGSCDLEEEN